MSGGNTTDRHARSASAAATRSGARLLDQLSRALARERRSAVVVQLAVDALIAELGATIAAVFLYDEDANTIRPAYTVNYPPDVITQITRLRIESPSLANLALLAGEVRTGTLTGDGADESPAFTRALGERMGVRAAAAVPLLAGGRRLGVLIYGLADPHDFGAAEIELLREVGDRVAAALERSRLEEELTRRAEEAELVQAILVDASGQEDLARILTVTLDRLTGLAPLTGGSIALVEGDELVLRAAAGPLAARALGQRLARGRGPAWRVIESGEPFMARDLAAEGYRSLSADGERTLRSYLAAALVWRGAPFGILEIDSIRPNAFDADDRRLLQTVAAALSGPIELARRYAAEVRLTRELGLAKGQLEAILAHAPMGVYFFDADHRLAYANQTTFKAFQVLPNAEFQIDRPWDELSRTMLEQRWAGTPEQLEAILAETRALRAGILEHDYPLRAPSQMLRRIAAPVFQGGEFSGHVVILFDVTAEREALAATEAAVAVREQFMSMASHELKTPLTSIRAAAQLLQRMRGGGGSSGGAPNEEVVQRQLGVVISQTDRLRELVDEMLDVARIQSGRLTLRPESAEFGALVAGAIAALPEADRARVRFAPAAPVSGRWDVNRVGQILANLLTNALKYSPPDQPVDVRLTRDDADLELAVTDYGIGIPEADLYTLFNPFARGRNAPAFDHAGLGLGLFICAEIAELHGGAMAVESVVGRGSTFIARLPLVTGGGRLAPSPGPSPARGGENAPS